MASVAQCLFCFETLVAKLEGRPPMTLDEVQEAWAAYPKENEETSSDEADADTSEAPASAIRAGLKTQFSSTTTSSASNSIPGSSFSSKPSTPQSFATSAPSSRPPTAASSSKAEPTYLPTGQGRRSQQSKPITESPLFVTWNTVSPRSHSRSLRGCIGTFEPQELDSGLRDYALTSALHDTRFSPISLSELHKLEVAVTLLTDFERCSDPLDWELGVHGIKISFYERHRRYSATYLPDVASEQGWTKEETLDSLVRKAGWTGRRSWKEINELEVVRYQGRKESVEYEEYKNFRDWVVAQEKRKKEAAKK